jgi:hypothetical protein
MLSSMAARLGLQTRRTKLMNALRARALSEGCVWHLAVLRTHNVDTLRSLTNEQISAVLAG